MSEDIELSYTDEIIYNRVEYLMKKAAEKGIPFDILLRGIQKTQDEGRILDDGLLIHNSTDEDKANAVVGTIFSCCVDEMLENEYAKKNNLYDTFVLAYKMGFNYNIGTIKKDVSIGELEKVIIQDLKGVNDRARRGDYFKPNNIEKIFSVLNSFLAIYDIGREKMASIYQNNIDILEGNYDIEERKFLVDDRNIMNYVRIDVSVFEKLSKREDPSKPQEVKIVYSPETNEIKIRSLNSFNYIEDRKKKSEGFIFCSADILLFQPDCFIENGSLVLRYDKEDEKKIPFHLGIYDVVNNELLKTSGINPVTKPSVDYIGKNKFGTIYGHGSFEEALCEKLKIDTRAYKEIIKSNNDDLPF